MAMSRRLVAAIVTMAACLVYCASTAYTGGIIHHGGSSRSHRERKPQRYYVLQVLTVSGEAIFEVASDLEIKERLKDYQKEYKEAKLEWLKARYQAKKNKEEFTDPPPKGPRLMRKMSKTFKKEEEARTYAEKLQKRWDELVAKKQAEAEAKAAKEQETKAQ